MEEEGEGNDGDGDDGIGAWLRELGRERQRRRKRRGGKSSSGSSSDVVVGLHPSLQGRRRARAWALLRRIGEEEGGRVRVGDPFAEEGSQQRRRLRRVVVAGAAMGKEEGAEGDGGVEWVAPAYLEACYVEGGAWLSSSLLLVGEEDDERRCVIRVYTWVGVDWGQRLLLTCRFMPLSFFS